MHRFNQETTNKKVCTSYKNETSSTADKYATTTTTKKSGYTVGIQSQKKSKKIMNKQDYSKQKHT